MPRPLVHRIALALPFAAGCTGPASESVSQAPSTTQPSVLPSEREAAPERAAEGGEPPIVYFVGEQLWRIQPDGSDARDLGFAVSPADSSIGSAIGEGDGTPTISPDGRWLAWGDGTDLWLTEFGPEGPTRTQITKLPPRQDSWLIAASLTFSTWSPDSTTLIVLVAEPGYEEDDPLPLPAGMSYGFHTLRSDAPSLVPAEHIHGVSAWAPDSKAVLYSDYVDKDDYDLLAFPIEPGPAQHLRHTTDAYGFSQIDVGGDWLAWTGHPPGSQILVVPLAGGEPKPMSPLGEFADIQWPRVAPDGAHVVFEWKGKLHLGHGPTPAEAVPVPLAEPLRWLDAEHLFSVTNEGLVLVDLAGRTKVLDAHATGLVRR